MFRWPPPLKCEGNFQLWLLWFLSVSPHLKVSLASSFIIFFQALHRSDSWTLDRQWFISFAGCNSWRANIWHGSSCETIHLGFVAKGAQQPNHFADYSFHGWSRLTWYYCLLVCLSISNQRVCCCDCQPGGSKQQAMAAAQLPLLNWRKSTCLEANA